MPTRRPNPKRAKLHRSYTVAEVRTLYGVHPHTIRDWIKEGLPVVDGHKPYLILGRDLRAFLERRNAKRKRPCPPGCLYCFACRQPRAVAAGSCEFHDRPYGAGQIKARCEVCGTAMH